MNELRLFGENFYLPIQDYSKGKVLFCITL